ncbi:cupin domain-containing protein [Halosegnis marinus]|uniref:Cupin domain-containing protein n=1 Tax=Halosegnis marinus TaxID=3034023 RepID=A0ABD5ZMX6_9EURY|nr:cupin domain-containing protein [Halosegnis sp. DT85]
MEKVAVEDVDSWVSPASAKRPVGRALGVEDAALNYYELGPGESFAFGRHRHMGQEEVFYVLSGEATFETGDPREGTEEVVVAAGELVRFGPGEWQQGWNRGEEPVRALAVGAPAESGETTILRECEACGGYTEQSVERAPDEEGALVTVCGDCGGETARFS